jgi:hypothetical protein
LARPSGLFSTSAIAPRESVLPFCQRFYQHFYQHFYQRFYLVVVQITVALKI